MTGVKEYQVSGDFVVFTNCLNDIVLSRVDDLANPAPKRREKLTKLSNPLDNPRDYCAGGFSNKEGCLCTN